MPAAKHRQKCQHWRQKAGGFGSRWPFLGDLDAHTAVSERAVAVVQYTPVTLADFSEVMAWFEFTGAAWGGSDESWLGRG